MRIGISISEDKLTKNTISVDKIAELTSGFFGSNLVLGEKGMYRFPDLHSFITDNDALLFFGSEIDTHIIEQSLKKQKNVLVSDVSKYSLDAIQNFVKIAHESEAIFTTSNHWELLPANDYIKNMVVHPRFIDFKINVNKNSSEISLRKHIFNGIDYILTIANCDCLRNTVDVVPDHNGKPYLINVILNFENGTSANLFLLLNQTHQKSQLNLYSSNVIVQVDFVLNKLSIEKNNVNESTMILKENNFLDVLMDKVSDQEKKSNYNNLFRLENSVILTDIIEEKINRFL
ncbi:MAG: hypothetical protein JXA53_11900 [Bacteroidales bacterium]|nr:hypothetical protein [Bacteroidales bacterium]